MSWKKLNCNISEVQLKGTLNGGQSFRWKQNNEGEWIGVFQKTVWSLKQDNKNMYYKVIGTLLSTNNESSKENVVQEEPIKKKLKVEKIDPVKNEINFESMLIKYFQLDIDLKPYYDVWSKADPHFEIAAKKFYGIRLLSQDPVENLFSFICSANNHISRITGLVNRLCSDYGSKICEYDGATYYSFPEVEALSSPKIEGELRAAAFGYRAKYIQQSANKIVELGGSEWVHGLKKMEYLQAKKELMRLSGIGAKVADCICLMSLGHLGAIPVDTHIYQIAKTKYLPHLKDVKNVTDRIYNEIGEHFRELYGPLAGWAHTILFCADLTKFQDKTENKPVKSKKSKGKK